MSNEVLTEIKKVGILGKRIGMCTEFKQPFLAMPMRAPKLKRMPCLRFDVYRTKIRFAFYTNRGQFWGPPVSTVTPDETIITSVRELMTTPVRFEEGFELQNALCFDLENHCIVEPIDFGAEVVEVGNHIQFAFKIPYAVTGEPSRERFIG